MINESQQYLESFSLFLSFVLSGFFSGSEAALVSISVDRTKQIIEDGGRKGKALKFAAQNAKEMLTTILIGNNLVNIFAASLTMRIAARYLPNDALAVSVGVTTLIILLFGEIIPKTFARRHAETLVVPIIRILQIIYIILYPLIFLFTWIISKVLGKNAELVGRLVTIDDIEFMVGQAEKEKTIDSRQIDLLNSILEFPSIKVKDIMIPRNQVKYITKGFSFEKTMSLLMKYNHSRYPVCEGELDKTIGLLHIKDLALVSSQERDNLNINDYLKEPFFVYEHMKIQAVFDHMNKKKVHLALVKDENNLVVGIVTLEDIVEEIFGDIFDEHDIQETKEIETEEDGEGICIEANISLRDLYNNYDIKIPLNDNYSTLAGFLLEMMGNNFPEEGMMFFWEGFSFKLESVENEEIKLVRISDVEGEKHIYSKELAERESGLNNGNDEED